MNFAIAVGRFYEELAARLVAGAQAAFGEAGVGEADVYEVPGAFELPLAALYLAESGRYAGVACLGAVIRGETTHDQHINRAVSLGLMKTAVRSGVPVLFGVLTCDTLEQAIHRSGGNVGNKGSECAEAALEMIDLLGKLPGAQPRMKD